MRVSCHIALSQSKSQSRAESLLEPELLPPFLVCRKEHFDEGVVSCLKWLPYKDAMAVLEELGSDNLTSVRNIPAYVMGICKR